MNGAERNAARAGRVAARREDCCGCFACRAICPCGAIDMAADGEGFVYAVKNDACVGCGLCLRVCPLAGAAEGRTGLDS